jgi:hypothetical protein
VPIALVNATEPTGFGPSDRHLALPNNQSIGPANPRPVLRLGRLQQGKSSQARLHLFAWSQILSRVQKDAVQRRL